jgi:hypothetical protein
MNDGDKADWFFTALSICVIVIALALSVLWFSGSLIPPTIPTNIRY